MPMASGAGQGGGRNPHPRDLVSVLTSAAALNRPFQSYTPFTAAPGSSGKPGKSSSGVNINTRGGDIPSGGGGGRGIGEYNGGLHEVTEGEGYSAQQQLGYRSTTSPTQNRRENTKPSKPSVYIIIWPQNPPKPSNKNSDPATTPGKVNEGGGDSEEIGEKVFEEQLFRVKVRVKHNQPPCALRVHTARVAEHMSTEQQQQQQQHLNNLSESDPSTASDMSPTHARGARGARQVRGGRHTVATLARQVESSSSSSPHESSIVSNYESADIKMGRGERDRGNLTGSAESNHYPKDVHYHTQRSDGFVIPGLAYDSLVCGASLAFTVRLAALAATEQIELACQGVVDPTATRLKCLQRLGKDHVMTQSNEAVYESIFGANI